VIRRLGPLALILLVGGCQSSLVLDHKALSDYDHVWNVTLEAVSSLMHLDEASKEQGHIRAHLASRWERSRAQVNIFKHKTTGLCDVTVNVYLETYTPYTTGAGIKSYELWRPAGRDLPLERKIVRQIRHSL